MADAIQVFKPGFRVTDANGDPVSGAIIKFFNAGTSTPRTVYSDRGLTVALGTTVTCNSVGVPASSGNAVVEVYTGNTAYRVQLTDSAGTLIPGMDFDEIIGALNTADFLTDPDIVPSNPVTNTSSNQAPALADKGKFYNIDCSGGDVTVTHIAAATLGDGWFAKYRHDGTANQIVITGTSSELFKIGSHAGVTQFALTERGQVVTVTCDGTGFKVEQSSPSLFNTTGVIAIADRLSTPPGSPQAGGRYIVGSAPTDDWSGYAQHDIAEYSGAGWFKITPPADCGWLAYVQDEDAYYSFQASAWAAYKHPATQTEMEAASSNVPVVTPGNLNWHPGVAKCWLKASVSAGTPTLEVSHNITSIADTNVGRLGVTIATDFSGAHWAALLTVERKTTEVTSEGHSNISTIRNSAQAAGTIELECTSIVSDGADLDNDDPSAWHFAGFGDQA